MMLPGFPDAAPLEGLGGGILIGLAAALMLLGAGRIAGVSGISARAFGISKSGMSWSSAWTFVIGLPVGAFIVAALQGGQSPTFVSLPMIAVAGLLVGFGTRLGSGCTSGHGVCGISRLSQRSIVATVTFMLAGIATVAVMNMLAG
ncbi:YeeE/YedE family protein [Aurantiacibacter gilvus]|uniref:YeeE/YedE thiosulfate transporter family protein n=1 Tax=Aurantiacibacter gilvus TaxID=3139141 RepID=A0ABU9IEX8_9SPHN